MQSSDLTDDLPFSGQPIRCRCLIDCPDGSDNSTCLLKPHAKCFKKLFINEFGETELRAGCLGSAKDQIDQCNKFADPSFSTATDLQCCNNGSLCNDNLIMKLPDPDYEEEPESKSENMNLLLVIFASVIIFCVIFGTIIALYSIRVRRREQKRKRQIEIENKRAACSVDFRSRGHRGRQRIVDYKIGDIRCLNATTSGSGMPLLVQRTVSKQIDILHELGQGRYGSVKLGRWRDEYVALKIYNPHDKESWERETEIYQTVMLRHDNVLGFIASDICETSTWRQLFLITEYHSNRSLYDYLHEHELNVADAIRLAFSACSGLSYLHTEITGTQGKPAIAHRDVKSKNFLVKNDGCCCVGDMALAVKYSRQKGKVDFGSYDNSRRTTTARYMAPEIITRSFHPDLFAAYKAADVYGFALVMWEIANRTKVKDTVNTYQPPYHDMIDDDHDLDSIRKVVVVGKLRPDILSCWLSHEVMSTYTTTMQECWVDRYESRLSMFRVRKSLKSLFDTNHKVEHEMSSSSSSSDRKPSFTSSSCNPSSPEGSSAPPTEHPRISTFVV